MIGSKEKPSIVDYVVVSETEVVLTLSNGTFQHKIINANPRCFKLRPDYFYETEKIFEIGAAMYRTQGLRLQFPNLMQDLFDALIKTRRTVEPDRARVVKIIHKIFAKWMAICGEGCQAPYKYAEIKNERRSLDLLRQNSQLWTRQYSEVQGSI